ncbi:unnamed protein product [Orchesella dallaii]|uniref:Uncharacterized protein n=1 Tax=Orchesella dallaii TaxID=48710 RepID=A0ABP1PXF3_9HEXA
MYRNDGNNCLPPMSPSSVDMLSPEYMLNLSPPFPADMRAAFHAFQAPPFQMLSFSAARSHLSMENSQRPQRILPNPPNCGNNELPRQLMLMGPPSDPSEGYPKGRRPGRELVRRPLDEHPYMPLAGRKRSRPGEHEEYRTKEETKELLIHKKAVVERETGSRIRSYVWEYMGPIRNIDTGKIIHNMIGCRYCSEVFYPYPDKSRGTSILRPHGCKQVGPIKLRHERMEKEREEGRHRQKQCLEFLSQENAASGASSPVSDLQISAWNLTQIGTSLFFDILFS